MEEVHPETDRERQLELQLSCQIRQLHSRTIQAKERQKELAVECRQANEMIESYQVRINEERMADILSDVEKAEQMLSELEQQRRKEQDSVDEYRKACERVIDREFDKGVSVRRETEKKSQEEAWNRIRMLKADSERETNEYRKVQDMIPRMIFKLTRLNDVWSEAWRREKKLRDELKMSDERLDKCTWDWERELRESKKRMSACSDEIQLSEARQNQFQRLIDGRYTKVEQARKVVSHAQQAVQNELDLAANQEDVMQQDISVSSGRILKLWQEIAQADTRQSWLDELKSTCGEGSSSHELFWQTSTESNNLNKLLKQVLQNEEQMFQRLQEMDENQKSSKKTLEMMSESIQNTREKIDRVWQGSEQTDQTRWIMENEEKLQKRLKEVSEREQRIQVETERALSEEKTVQQQLQQACDKARSFISQLKEEKDWQYCKCSLSYIFKTEKA